MSRKRVVITGIGIVSSVGIGKDNFWHAVTSGKSGISPVTAFDTSAYRCHSAGEIRHFVPNKLISHKRIRFLGRTSQLAIAAAKLAFHDAALSVKSAKVRAGIVVGTTMGERPLEDSFFTLHKHGFAHLGKSEIIKTTANNISANIGIYFKLEGLNFLISNACAAGNFSIGYGFDLIRSGALEMAVVGGADAFSQTAFNGFHRLYAMAPEKCQPFDKNRKGMMVGEGAGILVLESLEYARKRNAPIYAEIGGYGVSCDAKHITSPHAAGIQKAISKALKDADVPPADISYINAHGTGTPANDKAECTGIKQVFPGYRTIPVSSIKSMLGHTMGAASAIESAATCLAIKHNMLPPTINYETPDPECDIDCVPNTARAQQIDVALKNSFAFGGNNCCLIFKRAKER